MGLLNEVYTSRLATKHEWSEAPTSLIISAIKQMLLELRLHQPQNYNEDGALTYLTTLFQVIVDRLSAVQHIDIGDPEAFLHAALDYARYQGLDTEDIDEVVADSRKKHEVSR